MPTPKNYVRFEITTNDPELSFLIDCQKGEDIMARAREAVDRWCQITDTLLGITAVQFVCILRY